MILAQSAESPRNCGLQRCSTATQRIKQKPRSEGLFGPAERSGMTQVDEAVGLVAERDAGVSQRLVPVAGARRVGPSEPWSAGEQDQSSRRAPRSSRDGRGRRPSRASASRIDACATGECGPPAWCPVSVSSVFHHISRGASDRATATGQHLLQPDRVDRRRPGVVLVASRRTAASPSSPTAGRAASSSSRRPRRWSRKRGRARKSSTSAPLSAGSLTHAVGPLHPLEDRLYAGTQPLAPSVPGRRRRS